ncbi:uncharacterized protein LOC127249799 isoform X2 [Andrographis paniculata]|uniref:uncharacterized protein LOC127249799 isoform X2 n=1 Tax=Andrographis paniculata TaxID=175694 RepID=UPI0021E725CD|nr:uncharacterized protein LOC127249799 isoform X2 [Andrographis paniculata]
MRMSSTSSRLWEAVDRKWMDCLRKEPVEKLLQLPSGVAQDHWPASLKEYVHKLKSLSLPREQINLQKVFPGLRLQPLNSVLAQGMNQKKRHEIEALAGVIASVARRNEAQTVVDVGSGQGYLAQVLSFEHELSVIAIDASLHHGNITAARAKRIEKYYAAKIRKSRSEYKGFRKPKTVTCQVLSPATLKDISRSTEHVDDLVKPSVFREYDERTLLEESLGSESPYTFKANGNTSLILAGLHACGDLSVTMLRTFMECHEVKAVISIGCCYNLLSEGVNGGDDQCGFPMSKGAKFAGLQIGKNGRDLACQSAERWKDLGGDAGLHNFELHVFRAAFQMVLDRYYPEIIGRSPAIGRQGKALRRQHYRRIFESNACTARSSSQNNLTSDIAHGSIKGSAMMKNNSDDRMFPNSKSSNEPSSADRYPIFMEFCKSGLGRLGLSDSLDIEFTMLWKEVEQFSELVGPYWTLRAALGPVLETVLLLDRLLFLQEHGNVLIRPVMLALFDPVLSPRNIALVAEKV